MSAQRYRVGLVGFGRIAESAHLPAWLALPGVEVVAIVDHCAERRVAAQLSVPEARIFSSCAAMLDRMRLDCVDVCTPPHDHTPSILAACETGVSQIICEKPLVASTADYRSIAAAQGRGGSQVYTINTWV
ncbi:MAG: Gfo/Idh/MocA family protein, partial [Chloroflexota bacterium]